MIRALGLLTLTLIAACVAHSHAAPAGPPPGVCQSEPSPQDPYAEDAGGGGPGGPIAFDHTCGDNRTCAFECSEGGCSYYCAPGSTCSIECDGGGCKLACAPGATCNIECDGGRCGTGCGAGATCNIECDGGSCAQACAPEATCRVECDGGNCV
ncbi:MAG TPA: hypothetical protein VHW23_18190 [Kofleriaceae bacterium]|nr:hypothetical protein [Kofleriaceae bacterium]